MSINTAIIDYGVTGNTFNILKSLNAAGAKAEIVRNPETLFQYDKLVLPGVGTFTDAMGSINGSGNKEALIEAVKKKPTLGICLGMHILCDIGYETEETDGLGLVRGEVRKISCEGKIPHMGFSKIELLEESPIFRGINDEDLFYFMHSYELQNGTDTTANATYENHHFPCAFQNNNIFGVQFHPEKSRTSGLKIIGNFLKI